MNTGKIVQIIGPVVDVEFSDGQLPKIYDALHIVYPPDFIGTRGSTGYLVIEVQSDLGNSQVRCLAMGSTDGLKRGMEVRDTGNPIMIPVGKETLGRMFNVSGEPIDGKGPVSPSIIRYRYTVLLRVLKNRMRLLKCLKQASRL
jgi:F-type H+-transporting ATPase subunit beta